MSVARESVQSSSPPPQLTAHAGADGGAPMPAPRPYKRDALMYMVLLYTWVGIWRVQDLLPILGKMQFPLLVEIGTLIIFLLDKSPARRLKWIKSPILTMTVALLAIMLLGLPSSLWPGQGITFLTRDFAPTFVLFIILAASIRDFGDLEWLAFAHLIGGFIYAAYIFKFCPISPDGRLNNLVYYDANDFGLLMVCSMPFAVYFLRPSVSMGRRLFALCALGLFVLMIIRSGSRGGFLGLIAVVLYTLFFYRAVPVRFRFGAIAAGAGIFVLFGSAKYWTMMASILHPDNDYNMTEETGRKQIWKRGMYYMETHPILGVGIRAFPQAEGMLSPIAKQYAEMGRGIKWSVAHNSFVETGAECGAIALALFVFRFGSAFVTLGQVRVKRRGRGSPYITEDDHAYAQMLIASFLGFIVSGFFVSAEYFGYLYTLLALVLAQQAVLKRRARTPLRRKQAQVIPMQQGRPQGRRIRRKPLGAHWLPSGT